MILRQTLWMPGGASMGGQRQVVIRRGRHFGWWVIGRSAAGRLFMVSWSPTQGLAQAIAGIFGGETDPGRGGKATKPE
jgi:hypothetical protein